MVNNYLTNTCTAPISMVSLFDAAVGLVLEGAYSFLPGVTNTHTQTVVFIFLVRFHHDRVEQKGSSLHNIPRVWWHTKLSGVAVGKLQPRVSCGLVTGLESLSCRLEGE